MREAMPCTHTLSPRDDLTRQAQFLMESYHRLLNTYGHRNWWPAQTQDEIVIGAVLTQNVSWKNVAKAIANLKEAGLLSLEAIHGASSEELAPLLRPTRFFNVKVERLKAVTNWLYDWHNGDLNRALGQPTKVLRSSLLAVKGLGRETVDSIMLYAGTHLIFVVDAYTLRIVNRWGMIDSEANYDAVQRLFMQTIPADIGLYRDYHAQIVHLGHHLCWKKAAHCESCPLARTRQTGTMA